MNVILEKIEEYAALLDRKELLKVQTAENNNKIERCRDELAAMMINEDTPKISHGGFSWSLQSKCKYSCLAENREQLFELLRENDLGDIIQETVNAQTLNSTIASLVEANDDELPEEWQEVIKTYEYNDISRRREKPTGGKKK